MDKSLDVSNTTNLQKILQEMNIQNSNDTYANTNKENSTSNHEKVTSRQRLSTSQQSSNTLLYNLSALQTTTNNKIDALIDSSMRCQVVLDNIHQEQKKQTEILASISRNTINLQQNSSPNPKNSNNTSKQYGITAQNYGFKNSKEIISELIIKLLIQVEIKINDRQLRYRSTRVMESGLMNRAVEIACENTIKIDGDIRQPIKMPDNKNSITIYVASRIGSVDGMSPVLNPQSFKELFDNHECRSFTSIIQDVMERLRVIGIMLPYYEADMIKAISFPYFNSTGELICNWQKINRREETAEEAKVMNTSITNRKKIGAMVAQGIPIRASINAVIKE